MRGLCLWNLSLTGTVPPSLGSLQKLTSSLQIAHNLLSGTLPPSIGSITNIISPGLGLFLEYNKLTGTVPTSLSRLSRINTLDLLGNRFTGE